MIRKRYLRLYEACLLALFSAALSTTASAQGAVYLTQ